MNMLQKKSFRIFFRLFETSATCMKNSKYIAEPLPKRSLIRIHGEEVVPFLQGLVTNDMKHLQAKDGNPSMYTMFLNTSGRVLYDSIIYRTPEPEMFIIECDKEASNELRRHLRQYRVRRKIDIKCLKSEFVPWVIFRDDDTSKVSFNKDTLGSEFLYSTDPRLKELGTRVIVPSNYSLDNVASLFYQAAVLHPATSLNNYDIHRYKLGVGEGIADHPPGKAFPLEANCDFLHGVSFQKGCYVGQELTARVYHTGVIRKRLMPLKLSIAINQSNIDVQTQAGTKVGSIRSILKNRALAVLRVDQVLQVPSLMIDGDPCSVEKPDWWPKELPNKAVIR